MDKLPAELTIRISAHLPLETYIQYSQTCRSILRCLSSSCVIGYLNNRFSFGHDNPTGALLLFIFHNILKIPEKIRQVILNHFIVVYQTDASFIRGWSLIHAVICSNPGRFLELLYKDNEDNKDNVDNRDKKLVNMMPLLHEKKRSLLIDQQRLFAKKIYNSIIVSSIPHKVELCSSRTYKTIFTNMLQAGDLSTTEQCLRILGPPQDSIMLSDTDFNERFPTDRRKRHLPELEEYDNPNPAHVICRLDQYSTFSPPQMRLLAKQLLQTYQAKITFYPIGYGGDGSKRTKKRQKTTTTTTSSSSSSSSSEQQSMPF